jgi:hypothetical protein
MNLLVLVIGFGRRWGQYGPDQVMDGFRSIVEQGRAADSSTHAGSGSKIPTQGWSWTQANVFPPGVFGDRLRSANRYSMESIAARIRFGERGASVFSELVQGWVFPETVAGRGGRI